MSSPEAGPVEHRAPLLGSTGTSIKCYGAEALLDIAPDASITYTPLEPGSIVRKCCGLCINQPQHLKLQISGWLVVGAALESPNSFRIWYYTPSKQSNAPGAAAPKFKLRKTLPYVCSSGTEAVALVKRVRQAAAWAGHEQPPKILAIINPKSGQGKSQRLFQRHVAPVLENAAGMTLTAVLTRHPRHATEITRELDLSTQDIIVFVGGDGTVFEGLQGLLNRPDWDKARHIPLVHVPGGSGNGLAHSCGLRDPATAAFAICKGVVSPMDVASVLQPPNKRLYMMLLATYGMMSNLDVGTESLRWMGDTRFTLGALWEIAKGASYQAGIAWLPPATHADSSNNTRLGNQVHNGAASKLQRHDSDMLANASGEQAAGQSVVIEDFPAGPELPALQQLGRLPLTVPEQAGSAAADGSGGLPAGWQVMHEPLQMWSLINPPFIAASCKANPLGLLHSGHMNMFWVHGLTGLRGRLQALDVQAKSAQGLHLTSECLTQHKVRAMIFEPRDSNTCLMLDGEVVPSRPIFLEVHQGLIHVVINPAHPEEAAAQHSRDSASRAPTPCV